MRADSLKMTINSLLESSFTKFSRTIASTSWPIPDYTIITWFLYSNRLWRPNFLLKG